jgi:hypothetical protein
MRRVARPTGFEPVTYGLEGASSLFPRNKT